MHREYHKWHSPHLNRDIELLVFGQSGMPVLFFPTRTARFYDYENWHVIAALKNKIDKGLLQVYCVDSIDLESFYCESLHPSRRILRHMQYEKYILQEVMPFIAKKNTNQRIISAGCSLGAYHAVNLALRHPHIFYKVVGMSGRYDLTRQIENFRGLFDNYRDENIFSHTPNLFIPKLTDKNEINALQKLQIDFAIGIEDPFFANNQHLSGALWEKGIKNTVYVWEGEAHRPRHWRQMVQLYFR